MQQSKNSVRLGKKDMLTKYKFSKPRKCQFCNNSSTKHILTINLDNKQVNTIVECTLCKLRFLQKRLENIEILYSDKYWDEVTTNKEDMSKHFQYLIHYLSDLKLSKKSSILDIGAGEGTFLKECHEKGFVDLTATELVKSQASYLRKKYKFMKVICGDLPKIKISKKYDVIVLSHVIEHLYENIDDYLQKIYQLLKDDGIFIIRTPNDNYFFTQILNKFKITFSGDKYSHVFYRGNQKMINNAQANIREKERFLINNLHHSLFFTINTLDKYMLKHKFFLYRNLAGYNPSHNGGSGIKTILSSAYVNKLLYYFNVQFEIFRVYKKDIKLELLVT